MLLAGFIGGILAVVGLAAITPQLSPSSESAATAEEAPPQPARYGTR